MRLLGKGGLSEILAVCACAFGWSVVSSFHAAFDSASTSFSNASLQSLVVFEGIVSILLWSALRGRGWRAPEVGLAWRPRDAAIGIGLACLIHVSVMISMSLATLVGVGLDDGSNTLRIPGHLGIAEVVAVSIVNPVFEEVFVCGYLINAARSEKGFWWAINASVALRLSYHLYQGTTGVVALIPMGLIAAIWFVRTGRLWPIIIAHALLDLFALSAHV